MQRGISSRSSARTRFDECQGKTLRETIYQDKLDAREKRREIHFGKTYWSTLKAKFRVVQCSKSDLELGGEEPPVALFDSFKAMIKHPPNRSMMSAWCNRARDLEVVELKVVLKALDYINPYASQEQLELGMEILSLLGRSTALSRHHHLCRIMRAKYDEILTQVRLENIR